MSKIVVDKYEANGLYLTDGNTETYFRLSDYKIKATEMTKDSNGSADGWLNISDITKYSRDEIIAKLDEVCALDNGIVSQVLDASLAFIVGQFADTDFQGLIMAFIGSPGTFKTTLLKKLCFIEKNPKKQFCHFSSQSKYEQIVDVLNEADNVPFIVDDILPVFESSKKQKQIDFWNNISRIRDVPGFKGTVFLTSERMPQKLLSSSYDRIFFLQQRSFNDEEKKNWFEALSGIPDDMMACFWIDFIQVLLQEIDNVKADISDFLYMCENNDSLNHSTRMWDHFRALMTTRYIFSSYYLGRRTEDVSGFITSYIHGSSFNEQVRRITNIRAFEQGIDYIQLLYDALYGNHRTIKIFTDSGQYTTYLRNKEKADLQFKDVAYSKGDYVYILSEVVSHALNAASIVEADMNEVRNQIIEHGVISKNEGRSLTVPQFGKRHYRFVIPRLNSYIKNHYPSYLSDQNSGKYIIDVVRRKNQ